jgi:hypothetical protein
MRGGLEHLLELLEPSIEVEQLGTPLPDELLIETVATEHLHEQSAEVAEAFVSRGEQRTPLAPQRPWRGKDDAW